MARYLSFVLLVVSIGCGGGGDSGTVHGRLVNNGESVVVPTGEQASLCLHRLDASGKPEFGKTYPLTLGADGTFELGASGGKAPIGKYMVTLDIAPYGPGQSGKKSKSGLQGKYSLPNSPVRTEIVPGSNTLLIDLARTDQ